MEGLNKLTDLRKLSLSENDIRQFPNINSLVSLKELRLNKNKLITIPSAISFNAKLEILDLGNNAISSTE